MTIILACAGTIVVSACTPQESSYFAFGAAQSVSFPVPRGLRAWAGIATLDVKQGDTVRFVGVDAVGPEASEPVTYLVAKLRETEGGIGGLTEADLAPGELDAYIPLPGATFDAAAGPLGILVELPPVTRDLEFYDFRLRFAVNGGPEEVQRTRQAVRVCVGDPQTTDCAPLDPPNG